MTWISTNKDAITAVAALLGTFVALLTWSWQVYNAGVTRRQEAKNKNFEAYHRLIRELVRPQDGAVYIDQQIACLFELRHFSDYEEVTLRILSGLERSWKNVQTPGADRLRNELELTKIFLEQHAIQHTHKWSFCR